MASALSKVCYKYRVYMSPFVATLITAKHLNSDKNKNDCIIKGNNEGATVNNIAATRSSTDSKGATSSEQNTNDSDKTRH